jgi:hypothetical protein
MFSYHIFSPQSFAHQKKNNMLPGIGPERTASYPPPAPSDKERIAALLRTGHAGQIDYAQPTQPAAELGRFPRIEHGDFRS